MGKKKIVLRKKENKIPERYKKELNEEQYKVVTHENSPALVIAGAGSGKTRALTYRVALLIEKNEDPASIVLVTFTKKAAKEMTSRVESLVGSKARGINAGTFHHLANRTLRKYAQTIGFSNNFTILDKTDQITLMKLILAQFPKSESEKRTRFPKAQQLLEIQSKRIDLTITLKHVIKEYFPQYADLTDPIRKILDRFVSRKKETNLMDFDDLMVYFLVFLEKDEASKSFKKRISHVLVDEYQDVNSIQARIVDKLAEYAHSLIVVGDDAQAIYKFRGGDFTHMLNFPNNHPTALQYKLETNYRSNPEILSLANISIGHNQNQFKKNLKTSRPSDEKPMMVPCADLEQEAELICQQILEYRDQGIPLNEQAILFRSTYNSLNIEQKLVQENIPYEMRAGMRFFERAHIKDLLAFLSVIVNPADQVQWMRILSLHEKISNVSAQKILNIFSPNSNQLEQFCFYDLVSKLKGKRIQKIGIHSLIKLQNFYKKLIMDIPKRCLLPTEQFASIPQIIAKIIKYLTPIIKENYKKNFEDRLRDLEELMSFASKYSDITSLLGDILTQFDIQGETIEEGDIVEEEKPLILSTIHSSKGLEWKIVYMINLAEGRMPSSRAIGNSQSMEEERRLFYVGCTRAKDVLMLTYPRFLPYRSFDSISGPSRFLTEIQSAEVFDEIELEEE
ncbi:ATP-dependent helicase [Candidatus Lokiarchaeum ossiferum]|uniref:ATP-dependent helicase n=1 Tax=Candidatus Lokiarchaeum ossiferum TaxID=2951803 RepID=UPI00352C2449